MRELFREVPRPFAFVDLDRFDANVDAIAQRAGDMPVCVATKSVRSIGMIRRILDRNPLFHSLMAFSAAEAVHLAENGFDNILIAYPVWSEVESSGVCGQIGAGKTIRLMIDLEEHLEFLEGIGARHNVVIPLCIDIDMSARFPGLHFGVRRSGITTPAQAVRLFEISKDCPHLRLDALMGYEAQIAGVQDAVPGQTVKNLAVRWMKSRSIPELRARRKAVVEALRAGGCDLKLVNGGGTGSIESTREESVVTEVTAGSGFYTPTLFDHYGGFHHLPAAGYAIEIVRRPTEHIYTCHGGGYIASGAAGPDRLPLPYLPAGAKLLPMEGAGEVQTPIEYHGPESLSLGDPVFMRHAKAGELCERFQKLLLISKGAIVGETSTYRGDGKCFV
ncbi:MAG: amino acid deaminase/aldolase [Candidatus Hydrogenedens sp.]|nr:amino acid deaminase/aldolase [Candidatus Hydrogenedens sp.]